MAIKNWFSGKGEDEFAGEEYLEIDLEQEKKDNKVLVKLFVLKTYEDANYVLNALREGYTIAVIDIKVLKKRDPIELKRAISKIKKTVDALEGSIAGFGENTVIVTPSFARIDKDVSIPKEQPKKFSDEY
ncbi:MAG: cell division protein SepF [Nanoarchaeota archaeon]|nr:cell division protein SepF [Nanoarchaeota archaeon]